MVFSFGFRLMLLIPHGLWIRFKRISSVFQRILSVSEIKRRDLRIEHEIADTFILRFSGIIRRNLDDC